MFALSASASVYSTFPYDQEQQSDDLSAELRLGVVNAGDRILELRFDTQDSEEYNVSLPEKVALKPSEITESPEGEGWKYLGNGKYADIQEFSFSVDISRYRESNRIDIPLQISASPKSDSGIEGSSASISQETTHDYTIFLDPRLRPLERETENEKQVYYENTGEESLPEEWRDDGSGTENESKDYKANGTDENTGERDKNGVDTVTMILVLAIIVATGYLSGVI